jgi:SNF2 family DNA or RNA helicase
MDNKAQIQGIMAQYLDDVAKKLALFLQKILPMLFADWWTKAVIGVISFAQKNKLEQRRISTLDGLDLAALLRVLDQNWYQISNNLNLPTESRHFVKEMATIRNRWAHTQVSGFSDEDIYRDLDTIQRFAIVIGDDDGLIQEIHKTKKAIISTYPVIKHKITDVEHNDTVEFQLGQIVSVKSNPASLGAVVEVLSGKPENRFNIFLDGTIQTFYASQLQIEKRKVEGSFISCTQFHAHLTALQIKHPGLSTLYSLNAARVDFVPYQFRPVLRFIRSDRPRLLIADSVGVGKTIEAGLILRELQARREVRTVLIICPRPLVTENKWLNEMKRFEERFMHLDGSTLRDCINEMDLDGVWPEKYNKIIVPYSLLDEILLYGTSPGGKGKREKGLLNLDPPPRFDLVIVDEAHHIRNQDTFSHKAVKFFCDHAEAAIFLTATPIQLGNHDLFVLLNTLRPDLIRDQNSFEHMAEPNRFINQAVSMIRSQLPGWQTMAQQALEQAASTQWGQAILRYNPNFISTHSELLGGEITPDQRVKMIYNIEEMHTFSGIINRTRRRDIGDFTVRKPETRVVPFTPTQQHLHDELLRIQAEIFSRVRSGVNVKFMMTTIRRQAASCILGLAPFLKDILDRHLDDLAWEEADNTDTPDGSAVTLIQNQIQSLLDAASLLDSEDPKLQMLREIIRDKQNLPNNKIMLFSSFRHTLHYLFEILCKEGFRVGLIHGGTPDEERLVIRAQFEKARENTDSLDLLLFSEVGCEGLDYQFCDCIVNYDLPWNPMRIDQRIGRIDRRGQKSESIAIVNMITPGTVDADIYERCLMRIGIFNESLGENEEILGEITREIRNIAENLALNENERKMKLQQLADNQIRQLQLQEELEKKDAELFGIHLPQEQIKKDIDQAASFWLTSISLQRLVTLYLQHVGGKDHEYILGEKALKTLRVSQEDRSSLLRDFQQKIPRQNTAAYREWENWLKGGDQHLSITFDSDCAMQHPAATFIMPLHPLIKQAALSFDTRQRVLTNLQAESAKVPAGDYEFVMYQWKFYGIREDLILQPIASNPVVTEYLGRLLEKAVDCPASMPNGFDASAWDALDTQHHNLWSEARAKHQQKTREQAEYRRESLSVSHRARIALLEEQLNEATNEKIQKMRQSQLAAAEADYARHIQDLDIAAERADIQAEPVAYGVIHISEGKTS